MLRVLRLLFATSTQINNPSKAGLSKKVFYIVVGFVKANSFYNGNTSMSRGRTFKILLDVRSEESVII